MGFYFPGVRPGLDVSVRGFGNFLGEAKKVSHAFDRAGFVYTLNVESGR